jgi:hypothetical protein
MLDADILILEFPGFILGLGQELVQALRDIEVTRLPPVRGDLGHFVQLAFQLGQEKFQVGMAFFHQPRDQPAFLLHQRQEQVLNINTLVPQTGRRLLGIRQGGLRFLGKFA